MRRGKGGGNPAKKKKREETFSELLRQGTNSRKAMALSVPAEKRLL